MEINLSVNGDPGTGNSFNDTKIRKVDNYNPNAREVNNYYTQSESRLGGWFRRLNDEINNDIRLQKKLDDIKRYRKTQGWRLLTVGNRQGTTIEDVFCQEVNALPVL